MTTIAHPTLGITTTSDAMDLHSDDGYELGDGDIDLEFEPTPAVYNQDDDDLLLQDAAPDLGLDLRSPLPDQDDFMADKDDLIEEDGIEYDDVEVVDASRFSHNSHVATQEVAVEEDLIDYSDEEDEPPNVTQEALTRVEEALTTQSNSADANTQPGVDHGEADAILQGAEGGHVYQDQEEEHDYGLGSEHDINEPWGATETDWEQHVDGEPNTDLVASEQDEHGQQHEDVEAEGGGDFVDEPARPDGLVAPGNTTQVQHDVPAEQGDDVDEQPRVHPITVNYDGVEFWLFKPSGSEDSEDWLISDRSIQGKLLNELFQACRAALRNDINQDTEIGIRFDHFHNLEIYEDSTACLFVKLQDLIDTYLKLHAQDGTADPESFYITLQFRPRVSTLLGELNKAVRDGVGYSGLNTAVAAGQTAFNTPYSNNEQTEDAYENWEEEQELEGEGVARPDGQYGDGEEAVGLETLSHNSEQDGQYREQQGPASPHPVAEKNDVPSEGTGLVADPGQGTPGTPSNGAQTPARKQSPEGEGDTIEYSDEEDTPEVAQTDEVGQASAHVSVHDPSSGSSTVQGDDDHRQEDYANLLESYEDTEQPAGSSGGGIETEPEGEGARPEFDADFADYKDDDVAAEAYEDETYNQEFVQVYGEDAVEPPYRAEEYEAQSYAADDNYYDDDASTNLHEDLNFPDTIGDHNHFDGVSNQIVDDENFADVDNTFDFNGDETTTKDEDPVSLRDGTNDSIEDNYINYEDDEDGTVEQPTVATSAAAQPVAASSSGLDHAGSPQGLKRSIDEVGNGSDIGTDLSDAKRPRV